MTMGRHVRDVWRLHGRKRMRNKGSQTRRCRALGAIVRINEGEVNKSI